MKRCVILMLAVWSVGLSAQRRIIVTGDGNDIYPELVMGAVRAARFLHVIADMKLKARPHPGYPISIEVWSAPLPRTPVRWKWSPESKCEYLVASGTLAVVSINVSACQRVFGLMTNAVTPAPSLQWHQLVRSITAEIDYGGRGECRLNAGIGTRGIAMMMPQPDGINAESCRALMRGIYRNAGRNE